MLRRARWAVVAVLVVAGCATLQNTPVQDYVWEQGRKCNAAGITMTSVDSNGSYQLQGGNVTSFAAYTDCMKEQERLLPYHAWLAAKKKDSLASPPPVGATPR
jgi:hypothetical protein